MLHLEHSAILLTCIKQELVFSANWIKRSSNTIDAIAAQAPRTILLVNFRSF